MSKKKKEDRPAEAPKKKSGSVWAISVTVILILALIAVLSYQPSSKPESTVQPTNTSKQPDAYSFVKQGELRFQTPKQDYIAAIDIELAETEPRRELGLMYRDKMAENQGMLFIFDDEAIRSFWMKNTVLPLDMIFVNAHDEIVTIHRNTTPYSEQSYESTKPAKYVVEVNAGYTDRHKIAVGDRVSWSRF